uniref:LicD family protein n=1 Tax=Syphacia muris TaxID=451379 RepID=A0A0N5AY09_9BILA
MKVFDNFIQILFDDGIRAFRNLKYRTIVMDDLQLQIVVNDKVELDKMWRNSRFINCLNLNVSTARRVIPESYVVNLAKFRDYVEQYNSTIFLFGGTLLGWYRECSFIHDTTDVDFTMKIEDLNDNLLANLPNATGMSLYWMLGRVMVNVHVIYVNLNANFMELSFNHFRKNDSLEISVYMQNIKIDLFFLYRDTSYDWVGGMVVPKKEKLRWFYPHVDELCSGNLLGILFNVPCNVDDVLKADYGSNWRVPHSSSTFQWDRSHKNIHRVGFWKAEEWEQVKLNNFGSVEDIVF